MTMQINRLFKRPILHCALLLSALGVIGQVYAQMDHSSGMAGAMKTKPNDVCQGDGLQCANAATPFFTADGKLLLTWTANGVVSFAQSTDSAKSFSAPVKIAEHGKSLDAGSDARPQIVADKQGNIFLAYSFFKDANWNAQINTARSTDGGITFTAPASLVNDGSSQRFPSVRLQNKGWRIDYITVTAPLKDQLVDADIFPDVKHSDHCPVYLELKP